MTADLVIVYGLCALVWFTIGAPKRTQPLWAAVTILFAAVTSMYMGWF